MADVIDLAYRYVEVAKHGLMSPRLKALAEPIIAESGSYPYYCFHVLRLPLPLAEGEGGEPVMTDAAWDMVHQWRREIREKRNATLPPVGQLGR